MKQTFLFLLAGTLLFSCKKDLEKAPPSAPEVKATWTTTAADGKYPAPPYDIENNIWNQSAGPGPQTLSVNSVSDWSVLSNQPNTPDVKSYPNINRDYYTNYGTLINSASLKSSFTVTVPSSGTYNTSYDIWFDNYNYEVMVWANWKNVGPVSDKVNNAYQPYFTSVNIAGRSWNVWRGYTDHDVISFLPTSQFTSISGLDLKAIINWLATQTNWNGQYHDYSFYSHQLSRIGFGFEITSSSGGLTFGCKNYSVN